MKMKLFSVLALVLCVAAVSGQKGTYLRRLEVTNAPSNTATNAPSNGGSSATNAPSNGGSSATNAPSSGGATNAPYVNDNSATTSNAGCFPANASVRLEDGTTKRMDELRIGDRVLAGADGTFDEVYMFTHALSAEDAKARFVVLTAENGEKISLTTTHYLYVDGEYAAAADARVGQTLRTVRGESKIASVERVWAGGLYAPKTLSGDIVVDGVLASSYTSFLPPALTHSLLLPVRMMYKMNPKSVEAIGQGPPEWLESVMVNARGLLPF